MAVFGVLGYVLRKFGFPISPIVLSMVLIPNFESSFQQSMVLGMGDPRIFLSRPLSAVFVAIVGLILVMPIARWLWSSGNKFKNASLAK